MVDQRIISALSNPSRLGQRRHELRLFQRNRLWLARIYVFNGGFWAEGSGESADLALTNLAEALDKE